STRLGELGFRLVLLACIGVALATLVILLVQVGSDGVGELSLDFLSNGPSSLPANAGIRPALYGTLMMMLVCAGFIVPVGDGTTVYLEEYADGDKWWNRLIEVNIQNLAAVPSIIYGILGLAFLV